MLSTKKLKARSNGIPVSNPEKHCGIPTTKKYLELIKCAVALLNSKGSFKRVCSHSTDYPVWDSLCSIVCVPNGWTAFNKDIVLNISHNMTYEVIFRKSYYIIPDSHKKKMNNLLNIISTSITNKKSLINLGIRQAQSKFLSLIIGVGIINTYLVLLQNNNSYYHQTANLYTGWKIIKKKVLDSKFSHPSNIITTTSTGHTEVHLVNVLLCVKKTLLYIIKEEELRDRIIKLIKTLV